MYFSQKTAYFRIFYHIMLLIETGGALLIATYKKLLL